MIHREQVIIKLECLIDNMFVEIGGKNFQEVVAFLGEQNSSSRLFSYFYMTRTKEKDHRNQRLRIPQIALHLFHFQTCNSNSTTAVASEVYAAASPTLSKRLVLCLRSSRPFSPKNFIGKNQHLKYKDLVSPSQIIQEVLSVI